jgi:hypothetical protein
MNLVSVVAEIMNHFNIVGNPKIKIQDTFLIMGLSKFIICRGQKQFLCVCVGSER